MQGSQNSQSVWIIWSYLQHWLLSFHDYVHKRKSLCATPHSSRLFVYCTCALQWPHLTWTANSPPDSFARRNASGKSSSRRHFPGLQKPILVWSCSRLSYDDSLLTLAGRDPRRSYCSCGASGGISNAWGVVVGW